MKVLYIVTAYDRHPGDGITPWLVETLHRLRDQAVEVEVLAPSYRALESGRVDGIMVHRYRYAPRRFEDLTHDQTAPDRVRERPAYTALVPSYVLAGSRAAWRLGRTGEFDLVHVHWPLPHALPGWAARRAGRIPLVITFHGVEVPFARSSPLPFLMAFLRRAIRTADAVTANSSYTAGLIRSIHDRPVEILPFGSTVKAGGAFPDAGDHAAATSSPTPEAANTAASPFRLLFVGRLVERKGVHHLIDALAAVRSDRDVRLDVVGDGPERETLEARAHGLGLDSAVHFRGFVPEDELGRRYSATDAFILPATYDRKGDVEGLGVVLIEALAHGKPVIASDAGGIPDIVHHERTGLLVPPGDSAALARAIERLAADPGLAARLGRAGREHVRQNFDWDVIIPRLAGLYDRLVERAS